jgi:hypothetical protein
VTTEEIMKAFPAKQTEFSPYKVGKVLGSLIGSVPPQMVYNYITNGALPERFNNTGKKFLNRDDIEKFVTQVLESRAKKTEKEAEAETTG